MKNHENFAFHFGIISKLIYFGIIEDLEHSRVPILYP